MALPDFTDLQRRPGVLPVFGLKGDRGTLAREQLLHTSKESATVMLLMSLKGVTGNLDMIFGLVILARIAQTTVRTTQRLENPGLQ
eukprot:12901271-Alexandrium_andersonii.AAC.1